MLNVSSIATIVSNENPDVDTCSHKAVVAKFAGIGDCRNYGIYALTPLNN